MLELYVFLMAQEYMYAISSIVFAVILIFILDYFNVKNKRGLLYKYRLVALILILLFPHLISTIILTVFMFKMLIIDFLWEIMLMLWKSTQSILRGK